MGKCPPIQSSLPGPHNPKRELQRKGKREGPTRECDKEERVPAKHKTYAGWNTHAVQKDTDTEETPSSTRMKIIREQIVP